MANRAALAGKIPSILFWAWPALLAWAVLLGWQALTRHAWSWGQIMPYLDLGRFGAWRPGDMLGVWAQQAGALALLAGLLAAALGWGLAVLELLSPAQRPKLESFVYAAGLGLALGSLAMAVLGAVGLWFRPLIWILYGSFAGSGAAWAWLRRRTWLPQPGFFRLPRSWPGRALAAVAAGAGTFFFLGALAPEVFYDSLVYHLAVPAAFIKHHGFYPLPANFFSNLPLGMEMYYALGLLLADERLCRLLHASLALLSGLAVFALGRRYLGARGGRWAAGIFLTIPLFMINAAESGVDAGASFFALLALLALLNWRLAGQGGDRQPWLAGVFAGAALSMKYNTAFMLAPALLVLLWPRADARAKAWPQVLAAGVKIALAASLWVLPWFIKNFAYTGNPVFPFFYSHMASPLIHPEKMKMQMDGFAEFGQRTWTQYLRLPWDLTFYFPTGNSYLGVVFLFLLPGFVWLAWRWRRGPPAVNLWLLIAGGAVLIWSGQTQIMRYLMPAFALLALLGAAALELAESRQRALGRAARWGVVGFVTWGCLNCLSIALFSWDPLGVALGLETRDAYLDRQLLNSYAPMARTLNGLSQPVRVLFFGEARTYYIRPDATAATVYDRNPLLEMIARAPSAEAVWRQLRQEKYTHLYANYPEAGRTRGYEPYQWTPEALQRFRELYSRYLRPIAVNNGQWLYALRHEPDPAAPVKQGRPLCLYDAQTIGKVMEHYQQASQALRGGLWMDAEAECMRMQVLAPDWEVPYTERALLYLRLNRTEEALLQYRQAEALAWLDPVSATNLGLLYQARQEPGTAAGYFRMALSLEPKLAEAEQQLQAIENPSPRGGRPQ